MTRAPLTRILTAILAVVAAVALAGCGLTDPNQAALHNVSPAPAVTASTPAPADAGDPPGERGGTIPKDAQAAQNTLVRGAGRTTPSAALERYAELYTNWTSTTIVAHQRQLASVSLGQARAQALQAVATASGDGLLSADHVADSGRLVSLAPGQGGATGQWVLVTSEHTTGQGDYAGLPSALHVIYAQLSRTSQGWIVTRWQSQS
jgi:hypothetical protein